MVTHDDDPTHAASTIVPARAAVDLEAALGSVTGGGDGITAAALPARMAPLYRAGGAVAGPCRSSAPGRHGRFGMGLRRDRRGSRRAGGADEMTTGLRNALLAGLYATFALAPAAWADDHVPFHLRFAENQCPPWTDEALPRQEFLTDTPSSTADPPRGLRGDDRPFRLDDVGVFVVNGVRYAIPVGHMAGQIGDAVYEDAVRGGGHETTGLYGVSFWMPSGRYVERHFGSYLRFCEPGRPPPGPNEYVVSATVLPPISTEGAEWRAERLLWRERTKAALGAPISEVLAGRVPQHADRVVTDVPGAIVYDGLHWHPNVEERDQSTDPLKHDLFHVQRDDLFGILRCTKVTVAATHGARTRAPWEPCEIRHVGPINPSLPLPEMRYAIPRRNAGDWASVYWTILDNIQELREEKNEYGDFSDCGELIRLLENIDGIISVRRSQYRITNELRGLVSSLDKNRCDPKIFIAEIRKLVSFCPPPFLNGRDEVYLFIGPGHHVSFGWSEANGQVFDPTVVVKKSFSDRCIND